MEQQGEVLNFESEIFRQDGTASWISENAHIVRDAAGETLYYEGTVQDISERRHYQEQLERQANHDMLTGCPTASCWATRVSRALPVLRGWVTT